MSYQQKYLKYKQKYLELKRSLGGMPGGPGGPKPVVASGPKAWGPSAVNVPTAAELAEAAAASEEAQDLDATSRGKRRAVIDENGKRFDAEFHHCSERVADTSARVAADASIINRQLHALAEHDLAMAREVLRGTKEAFDYYSHKDYGMDVLSKGGPPYRKALAMPALFKVQLAIGTESAELKQTKVNKARIQAELDETVRHFDASSRAVRASEAQRAQLATQIQALNVPRINRGDRHQNGQNRWGNGVEGDNAFGLALAARDARIAENRPNVDRLTNQLRQLDTQLAAARAELANVKAKLEALLENMNDIQIAENYFMGRLKNRDDPANTQGRPPLQAPTPLQRERALRP